MLYSSKLQSPFGDITAVTNGEQLVEMLLPGQSSQMEEVITEVSKKNIDVLKITQEWLDIYFTGKEPDFMPKIKPEGTAFREAVWGILLKIPYGEVTTYGWIAEEIARERGIEKMSAQAIGGAVSHNPISIIVPCHRVIGKGGNLTGYGGGLGLKIKLLKFENSYSDEFWLPKSYYQSKDV